MTPHYIIAVFGIAIVGYIVKVRPYPDCSSRQLFLTVILRLYGQATARHCPKYQALGTRSTQTLSSAIIPLVDVEYSM